MSFDDVGSALITLSALPYLFFLYLLWRIARIRPDLLHPLTITGFFSMVGFIIVSAVAGVVAVRVMGAESLGHVDWLHGTAEGALTITNGLIVLGLKRQLQPEEEDEDAEKVEAALVNA